MISGADQRRTSAPATGSPAGSYSRPVDLSDRTRIGLSVDTDSTGARITSMISTTPVTAMVAGPLPGGSDGPDFQAAGLDGIPIGITRLVTVPYAPGGGADVALVPLDALASRTPPQ